MEEDDEKTLQPDHPDVAANLFNFNSVISATGSLEEAEKHYRCELEVWGKSHGPDHPGIARGLSGLAKVLYFTGEEKRLHGGDEYTELFEEAELCNRRALKIAENAFGAEHPMVVPSLDMLAEFLDDTNRDHEAEVLYRRVLKIQEVTLGPDHLDLVYTLNNIARLLQVTGTYKQMKPLHKRVLEICRAKLGPEHPETKQFETTYGFLQSALD